MGVSAKPLFYSFQVYIKMIYGNYIGRDRYESTHTLDGGNFSAVPWVSGLFNGKGRYTDKITGNEVTKGLDACEVFFYIQHLF